MKNFFWIYLFTIYYLLFTILPLASAQTMSNTNYKLKMGNFNFSTGNLEGSGKKIRFTSGELSPGLYSGTNYKVRTGFQYIKSSIAFAFSISPTLLDFGIVSPNNPITRTNTLTVSNGATLGYTVTVSADRQPSSKEGNVITATSCDSGSCNESRAATWISTLTYGLGYRCDPPAGGQVNDCDKSFSENFFKPLPISPSSQTIMQGGTGRNKKSQVTYKVNIPPTQRVGTYTNTLTFIAAPKF